MCFDGIRNVLYNYNIVNSSALWQYKLCFLKNLSYLVAHIFLTSVVQLPAKKGDFFVKENRPPWRKNTNNVTDNLCNPFIFGDMQMSLIVLSISNLLFIWLAGCWSLIFFHVIYTYYLLIYFSIYCITVSQWTFDVFKLLYTSTGWCKVERWAGHMSQLQNRNQSQ